MWVHAAFYHFSTPLQVALSPECTALLFMSLDFPHSLYISQGVLQFYPDVL